MYYNSNNAVLRQPTVGANKVSSIVSYAMNGLFERLENIFEFKSGIKSSAVGYNSEKYEQLEKIYSMAYTKINSLEKNINSLYLNCIQYSKTKIKEDKYAKNNRKHTIN